MKHEALKVHPLVKGRPLRGGRGLKRPLQKKQKHCLRVAPCAGGVD